MKTICGYIFSLGCGGVIWSLVQIMWWKSIDYEKTARAVTLFAISVAVACIFGALNVGLSK